MKLYLIDYLFLENAEMAMEPSKAIKEYKEENAKLEKRVGVGKHSI